MNSFIDFNITGKQVSYFFNKNHFLLLLIGLVIIIFFSMYASRQKIKFQKIFVFVFAILILILEGLRIFWRYKYLEYNYESLNFANVVELNMFTLSLWISIPLIIIGSFLKTKNKRSIFGLSFVFNVTMLSAIISLVYPTGLNSNFEFYHCYNLIYVLLRSFVIMLSMLFVAAKWISVCEFLDLWKGIVSLLFFGLCCGVIYYFIGNNGTNLFYFEYCPLFVTLGIYIPFPWHIFVMGAFLFVFQLIIYLPFRLFRNIKNRHL